MSRPIRYLLVVTCSLRKQADSGLLPAIERYDGGTFRVLRRARREGYWPPELDVLILSARYGLIDASTRIPDYEQRMTRKRAEDLREQVKSTLRKYAEQTTYSELYVDVGADYRPAIESLDGLFSDSTVIYAEGRIGERLAQLKHWLTVRSGA